MSLHDKGPEGWGDVPVSVSQRSPASCTLCLHLYYLVRRNQIGLVFVPLETFCVICADSATPLPPTARGTSRKERSCCGIQVRCQE